MVDVRWNARLRLFESVCMCVCVCAGALVRLCASLKSQFVLASFEFFSLARSDFGMNSNIELFKLSWHLIWLAALRGKGREGGAELWTYISRRVSFILIYPKKCYKTHFIRYIRFAHIASFNHSLAFLFHIFFFVLVWFANAKSAINTCGDVFVRRETSIRP